MKKIQVIVRDKNTLVLEEDAAKGDYIDLSSISNVDFKQIENAVLAGKDTIYNQKLSEFKEMLTLQLSQEKKDLENKYTLDRQQLLNQLEGLKKEHSQAMESFKNSTAYTHNQELDQLNRQLKDLKDKHQQELDGLKKEEAFKHSLELQALNAQIEQIKQSSIQKENETSAKYQMEILNLKSQLSQLQNQMDIQLNNERLLAEKKYTTQITDLNQKLR
ncbi:MAG: hypothetical protein K2O22_00300, partial [Anaeroplasmataceae bacterium]|nr:hypothetical protein [Anaeroplasmataceae bacterium]